MQDGELCSHLPNWKWQVRQQGARAVKAMSLQIRPDISKFSFNPPQVIGHMKLNWIKRKPKTIHKPSFPTPESLSLIGASKSTIPDFCLQNFQGEKRDIGDIFFFKYRRCHLFVKKRVRVRCPKQKHAHQSLVCFSTQLSLHVNSGFPENIFTYEDGMLRTELLWEQMKINKALH